MAITSTPINPKIGFEITGLSGLQLVDDDVAKGCLSALEQYGVVVYRDANLADPELVAFSRMLGDVVVSPHGALEGYPEIQPVSLDPAKDALAAYRKGTFYWHIDGAQDAVPQKATLLAALEVAEDEGDTEFANTYAAYEDLPEQDKAAIDGLRVVHALEATQRLVYPDPTPKQLAAWAAVPSREHPIVWTRQSGRKSLLVGATGHHVAGLPEADSRALLDRMLAWSTRPEFVLRHQWRRGDLVVWDNTAILHRALPYQPTSRRLLHRTTLVGEQEVA